MTTIGNQIYKYRTMEGLTLKELADKVGVTEGAVSYWESGKSSPHMPKIVVMAKIFNIDPSSIIFGEPNSDDKDEIIESIIVALHNNHELKTFFHRCTLLKKDDMTRLLKVLEAILPERDNN